MSLKLLSLDDVKQSISMAQAIQAMEDAFIQLARQQVKLPLRTGITIEEEEALSLTMPAYLAQDKTLGLKVVSIFPKNIAKNIPSITGFIMLLDATTGEPKALMDAGFLTALRTGAISGLATHYFAKQEAHQVAILGTGTQSHTQLEAVAAVRPITHVSVWSRNINNAQAFAKNIAHQYNVQVHHTVNAAIKQADIICTATSSTEPLIELASLKPHAHINAIGSHTQFMQEISAEVLSEAVVIVDQVEAVLQEAGEIIAAIEKQALQKEQIIELGQWLIHKTENYKDTLTVFKSVGLAIQDVSVAEVVYQNALHNGLGLTFSLNELKI
ncbi:ornithine cyclodeaminase [Legionella beliardensis]|uniref:Ornithine cyclodeaminase n=1 Tax=Legionella beliardensis TaxID=91822 RepID=A0A378I0X6_9GAMM|nr:ornithine cyclodeaminase family protein [Legionella beliardensis]STX28838.1 ornithine cyclodeaminase [Legionella beliardensis]